MAIDVHTRKVVATWQLGCGEAGPRGLAYDAADRLLLVACTTRLVALDARTGAVRGEVATGEGNDNIDFFAPERLAYVASGKAATLMRVRVEPDGEAERR